MGPHIVDRITSIPVLPVLAMLSSYNIGRSTLSTTTRKIVTHMIILCFNQFYTSIIKERSSSNPKPAPVKSKFHASFDDNDK